MNYYKSVELLKNDLYDKDLIDNLNKNHYHIQCPFHNEVNGYSLYLNLDKGYWKCFGKCNRGSNNLNELCNQIGSPLYFSSKLSSNYKEVQNDRFDFLFESKKITLSNNQQAYFSNKYSNKINEYLTTHKNTNDLTKIQFLPYDGLYLPNKRFLPYDLVKQNNIRYSTNARRIYMPYYYNHTMLGYVSRSILDSSLIAERIFEDVEFCWQNHFDQKPSINNHKDVSRIYSIIRKGTNQYLNERYAKALKQYALDQKFKNSFNLPRDLFLYEPLSNDLIESDYVFIVESIIDAISLNYLGVKAFAILGGFITEDHKSIFIERNLIPVKFLDNDKAGQKFSKQFDKVFGSLQLNFKKERLQVSIKDANDLLKISHNQPKLRANLQQVLTNTNNYFYF